MLRRVEVKNYKSLASIQVDLGSLTMLVGANGAGKSNFVDALRFVKECLTQSVGLALQSRGGIPAVRRISRGHPTNFGVRLLLSLGDAGEADYSFEIAALPKAAFEIKRERCVVNMPLQIHRYEIEGGKFKQRLQDIRPRIEPDRLALTVVSGLQEFRPVYDFLTKMQFYSLGPDQIRQLQDADAGNVLKRDGSNAAAVLREIRLRKPADYERLCRLLAKVVPGVKSADYSSVGQKETIAFKQYVDDKEPWTFQAINMSDGTLRVLGILLAVYQTSLPSIIAIEEPEATLHPAALEVLMDVLRDGASRTQILLTTHSPDILDTKELRDDQIRVVEMTQGRTIITPVGPTARDLIRKQLYTLGELLRISELEQDKERAEEQANQPPLNLFSRIEARVP